MQINIKNNDINKVYNYLVIVIFYELILGGLGKLFGLPIRNTLFIIGVLATLYMMYKDKVRIEKTYIISIVVFIVYVIYGSLIGIINGNSLRDIFSDANSFLGIIYLILLVNYFKEDFKKINNFLDIVINASTVVAIITIGLFFFSRIYLPEDVSIISKYMELNRKLNYGLITGLVNSNNYARVYLFNGIFMQVAAMILMVRLLSKSNNSQLYSAIKLLILLIGIFVSNTRGFWLGTGVGIVFLVIYYLLKRKQLNFSIKKNLIVLLLLLVFVSLLPLTVKKPAGGISSGTESAKDRLESIVDFEENISNKVRAIQMRFLGEKIKEKPILGFGFGAHIHEYPEYMKANNLQSVNSSNFEFYYVELIFKTGFLGIIYLFGYLIYKFMQLVIILVKYRLGHEDEQILAAWTIASLSFLSASVTNPYLANLSGIFILVMECYILDYVYKKYAIK